MGGERRGGGGGGGRGGGRGKKGGGGGEGRGEGGYILSHQLHPVAQGLSASCMCRPTCWGRKRLKMRG